MPVASIAVLSDAYHDLSDIAWVVGIVVASVGARRSQLVDVLHPSLFRSLQSKASDIYRL